MSGCLNEAVILGHLGRDPELRNTQDGTPVANLSVATSETWKDRNTGEKRERTEWHRVTIWGPLAEVADKYLSKGSKAYFRGRIETRKWQDQSGQDRYSTEIVLRGHDTKMVMLDGQGGGASSGDTSPPPPGELDDEIPF